MDFEAQKVRSNRVSVELSLAGPAWWWRQETIAETREKAAIPPVYRALSRTRNVEKATWFSGLSVRPFLALVSCCPGCVGAPGLWPSVPVLVVGLAPHQELVKNASDCRSIVSGE